MFARKAKEHLEKYFEMKLSGEVEKALTESVGVEYAVDQFEQIVEFMSGTRPSVCPLEELNHPG